MQIKYHLDESVRNAIADSLRRHGIDVSISLDANLVGAADKKHLLFANASDRIIVTHDDDYLRLNKVGVEHSGIAYCHQSSRAIGEIVRKLVLLWRTRTAEEMRGLIEYL